jgi:tetratricopeptide (TPR) repeat protein
MTGVIRKALSAITIIISICLCVFSINQWRSESSYPIQRNFTRSEALPAIPDSAGAERILHSISLLPGISEYHVLIGKYYVSGAPKEKDIVTGQIRNLLDEAKREYIQALFLNPAYTEVLGYLAWVNFELGKTTVAIDRLETAIKLEPNNYFPHIFYGICVSRFLDTMPERLKKVYLYRANMEFNTGLAMNPSIMKHPTVLMARANLYLRKGDFSGAVKQLEKLGSPDKENLPYHIELASSYLKLGREKAGLKKYLDIVENPDIDVMSLGIITSSLKRQTEIYPDNVELGVLLGRAYFKEQKMELALEALKKVVREKPDNAEAHYLMGQIFETMGDEDASYREYLKTLEYSRNHKGASERVLEYNRKRASGGGSQVP